MVDLDISYYTILNEIDHTSSLIELKETNLLKCIKDRRGVDLKHFIICTYDQVFEVACREFEIAFN
jgi:hypothetical protein